jgi:hypothetical protein
MPPAKQQYVGYFFLLIFLSFAIGMLANSLFLERKAQRAAEGFEADEESTYFVDLPPVPQQAGVTDHDYWVKKNRSGA